MIKKMGFFILMLVLAVIVAGCGSSTEKAQPTVSPEKQAALNASAEKAARVSALQGAYSRIDGDVKAASFLPPQTLNKSVIDADIAGVDAYMAALSDFKSASAHNRTFLNNSSSECRQAMNDESAADVKLTGAGDLKKVLGLVNEWLAGYGTWNPANDSATMKIKDMYLFASLANPFQTMTPADGIRWFNEARPAFAGYLNESATMIGKTDALIAVMGNSTAKDSLVSFRNGIQTMNAWVKTNYNQMVATYNQMAGSRYGMQAGL